MARPQINPAAFQGKSPAEAASMLLQHFGGDGRRAEVEGWRIWESFAGGEPGRRRDAEGDNARYFSAAIKCICDETEMPKVPRKPKGIGVAFQGGE